MSENTVGVAGTAAAEIEIPVLPGEHMVVLIGTAHGEWSMPEPRIEQVTSRQPRTGLTRCGAPRASDSRRTRDHRG